MTPRIEPLAEVVTLSQFPFTHASPLVVGVSGHRDLRSDNIESAKRRVGAFLDELSALIPNTPIRVMVGMAEGADLLVAAAALERNLPVDAVLPMPVEDYLDDFSAAGRAELERLLADPRVAQVVLEVPHARPIPSAGPERDALYMALAHALRRRSSVLIALWNGEFSALPGGTADTVMRYLEAHTGPEPAAYVSFLKDDGDAPWDQEILYWVPVARSSDTSHPSLAPCFLSGAGEGVLRRHTRMPEPLRRQLIDLDRYNREFAALQAEPYARNPDTLMPTLPATISASERVDLRRIDIEYGKADALAVLCQLHSNRLFRWFSYMAATMGLLFLIYAKLLPSKAFLLGYLSVMLLGVGAFHALKSHRWFSKHLAYRVLAETMRTQFFLRLTASDVHVSATELIKLAGIDQFEGFAWITNVLRNVEPLGHREPLDQSQEDAYVTLARGAWIDAQQSYFRSKVSRLERAHRRLEHLKTALITALVLIAVVLVATGTSLTHFVFTLGFNAKDFLLFVMGLLPVWLGIWEIYEGKMATRELLWQYRNQLVHFSRATVELRQASDRRQRASILAALGKDSLMESYLWTIHRYHREHEPPAAG